MATIINASTSNGLIQSADTSGVLELQSGGTTKLTVASTGAYGQLQSATAQTSTSGTSIDFTSIPSWVKRITIMFDGVSVSGSSNPLIQIGDSGGIEITGYLGASTNVTGSSSANYTTGFGILSASGTNVIFGHIILTNLSANVWVSSASIAFSNAATNSISSGSKTLSATLDRVRITTVNGTDTFDAGSINIMYEG